MIILVKRETLKGTYTISGDKIIVEEDGKKAELSFSIKDDILTISVGNFVETYKKNARKTPPVIVNPFIGSWVLESVHSTEKGDLTSDCSKKSVITIRNGEMNMNFYDDIGNGCEGKEETFHYSFLEGKVEDIRKNNDLITEIKGFVIENGKLIITMGDSNDRIVCTFKNK